MARAIDVASMLIRLAAAEDEPEFLCHMRLQKLLYYCEGWSLALRDSSLFPERIEAWAHGPVVRDLYPTFAHHGSQSIDPKDVAAPENLTDDEAELIGSVWEAYKGYTAIALRQKTHAERPWQQAHGKLGPTERCSEEITRASMVEFFAEAAS